MAQYRHTQPAQTVERDPQAPSHAKTRRGGKIAATVAGIALLAGSGAVVAPIAIEAHTKAKTEQAEAERKEDTRYVGELATGGEVITIDRHDEVTDLDAAADLYLRTLEGTAPKDQIVIIESEDPDGGYKPLVTVIAGHPDTKSTTRVLGNEDVNLLAKGYYLVRRHYRDGVPYDGLLGEPAPIDASQEGVITDPQVVEFFSLQDEISDMNEVDEIAIYSGDDITIGMIVVSV